MKSNLSARQSVSVIPAARVTKGADAALWTPPFVLALAGLFLFYGSFYLTLVALPRYLVYRIGAGPAQIGIVTGLFSLGAMLPRPFVGRLADRGGVFRPMLAATGMFALASVAYLGASSLLLIVAVRLLHGSGMAFYATASPTLVAALAPSTRRAEAMGYWGMASIAALALFPAIGLALVGRWGYGAVFGVAAVFAVLSGVTVLLARLPASRTPPTSSLPSVGRWLEPRVCLPALAGLALAIGNNVVVSFTVLLAAERHIAGAGAFFAVYAAALFAYRIAGRRLADRRARLTVAIPGYLCIGAGLLVASLAHSFPPLAVAGILGGIGLGAAQPALLALTVDRVPPERRGAGLATFYVAWEIGAIVSAMLLGGAAQVLTYGGMFAIAGAVQLGTAFALAFIAPRLGRDASGAA